MAVLEVQAKEPFACYYNGVRHEIEKGQKIRGLMAGYLANTKVPVRITKETDPNPEPEEPAEPTEESDKASEDSADSSGEKKATGKRSKK